MIFKALRCGILLALVAGLGACTVRTPISGFEPFNPPQKYNIAAQSLDIVTVDSLRPTFKWSSFPGIHEGECFENKKPFIDASLEKVKRVTYQLRIWETENNIPGGIVYDRRGIPSSSHAIDKTLAPNRLYFWSVRAEFIYDGTVQLSEWSLSQAPSHAAHGNYSACDVGFAVLARTFTPFSRTGRMEAHDRGVTPTQNYYRFKTPSGGS